VRSSFREDLHYYELFEENFFATGRNERIGAALNHHSAPEKEIAEARGVSTQHGWPKSLEVHCLRVRRGKGLLLRPSGHEDDEYVRVGYFYLFNYSLGPSWETQSVDHNLARLSTRHNLIMDHNLVNNLVR
jgi:hypothetical protein